jgi:multidrug efflux pump subunit AcrA (membrane-fusion protein)
MFVLPKDQQRKLETPPLVVTRPSLEKLSRILGGTFLGTILCLMLMPWQQTVTGSGRVIAFNPTERPQTISAPVDGRLGKWFVTEGTHVQEGDTIVELTDNDPEILSRLKSERAALQQRLTAARLTVSRAKLNVDRQHELFEKGISARRAFEQAEIEYARFLADEASSAAELTRIEVRLARQSTQKVVAPRAGTILRRLAGQESVMVKAGDALAELVPSTLSRAVEVWIRGNDAPLIREGGTARLQFEGWPAIQFSGWPSVAVGTFGGTVSFIDAADNGKGYFRVVIVPHANEPWPDPMYLRQGVRVHAWVLLRRVTLGFELWRNFNGFPPALSDAQGGPSLSSEAKKEK